MAEEMKVTKEEFEKAVEWCANNDECYDCPFDSKPKVCGEYFARYIYDQKNEPAPAPTETSSNENILHLDDSILLDICQEELAKISKIALDDYPNEFITGYINAISDVVKQLRGGYRMSHEERRLLAGTHELFKKKEE